MHWCYNLRFNSKLVQRLIVDEFKSMVPRAHVLSLERWLCKYSSSLHTNVETLLAQSSTPSHIISAPELVAIDGICYLTVAMKTS